MSHANPPGFGVMVRTLLIDAGIVTRMGNPDWTTLARRMPDVNYESLRKAVVGERTPSEKIILATAAALGVKPTVFVEYRLLNARRSFDPDYVGWSAAMKALNQWEAKG
jgi:hypothetical protein